ncbi:MAG: nucleotide exchange factor GrpE [Cytophagales bacterium]
MAKNKKKKELEHEEVIQKEKHEVFEDNTNEEDFAVHEEEIEKEDIPKEEKLQKELDEYKDKYLRLYSEFENFRRRTNKEKYEVISNANERLLVDILPIVDDFERAEQSFKEAKDLKAIKEGVDLIYNKFLKTLESKGVKKMKSKGEVLDTEKHEAITQIPVEEKKKKGKIVDVIEEGYTLNDKVIRYAKVVIGQ